ncbi:MAG TPA: DUF2970 domain-containing protein [Burkholderiaceae bacterium]|nr:DUF2970 domain-containing protein [Burkholderiaceae bacterium]
MNKNHQPATQRKLNFLQTVKTVLWGLFGVRKGKGWEDDLSRVNPVYLIITAVIAIVLFVLGLVTIARWLAGQAI